MTVHLPQFIKHSDFVTFGLNDRCFNLRIVVIYDLAAKAHLLAAVQIHFIRVDALQEISEQFDKLLLLRRGSLPPMGTERSLGHPLIIKDSIERLSQSIHPFPLLIVGTKFRILQNLNRFIDTRAHELQRCACMGARKKGEKQDRGQDENLYLSDLLMHWTYPFD